MSNEEGGGGGGFPGGLDLGAMMQQAQQLQEQMLKAQEEAKLKIVEASAGGGMVSVTISGGFEVKSIKIDPACIDPKDPSMLQDLIIAAINQAIAKAQELQAGAVSSVTGGLNIPGLF
ncbi:MAG: YbaB/EbfC family nucleoid-associated protein [Myxococcales bacterium]|nr:YbaB/EbfC family nucleoid-associated protein [Myxococcales bacterium]